MEEYVIDANIIFSGLISGKGLYLKIFEDYVFYTPDFALVELQKYQSEILKKTKLKKELLKEFIINVFSNIIILPDLFISEKSRIKAYNLCKDIDLKDTIYVSLAIELNKKLITRDIPLYEGLLSKGFKDVIMFDEFVKNLENK